MKKALLLSTLLILFLFGGISSANTTITHYKNSNISYTLNGNETFTGVGTITITDGDTTITILDRNLGARNAGMGCEDPYRRTDCYIDDDTYGYHFQWGNNYGFSSNGELSNKQLADSQANVSSIKKGYSDPVFHYGYNNWINSNSKIDMWGGKLDDFKGSFNSSNSYKSGELNGDNWKVSNAIERQGPCPEGFHVPSNGERLKLADLMGYDSLWMHEKLLIPFAGLRYKDTSLLLNLGYGAFLWGSTPYDNSSARSSDFYMDNDNLIISSMGLRGYGYSVRCFYNKYEAFPNGYSKEFSDAYKRAYENGITTIDSIENVNIGGKLSRIEMAKMLSNYALIVLNKTQDYSRKCKFSDVSAQLDAQYNNGAELACQLGIMGVGINEFRPNDKVTRAEFGTALSRMLFGTPDGNPYYATHLAKLKNEGIITNDDPKIKELRGYVMVMLMRASDKIASNNPNTPIDPEDAQESVDYNNKVMDLINNCTFGRYEFDERYDDSTLEIKDYEIITKKVIDICKNSIEQINELGAWKGDSSLQNSALKFVALYVVCYKEYLKILPYYEHLDSLTPTEEEEFDNMREKLEETFDKIEDTNDELITAQENFAKKFGFEFGY